MDSDHDDSRLFDRNSLHDDLSSSMSNKRAINRNHHTRDDAYESTDRGDLDVLLPTEQVDLLRRELEQERRERKEDVKLAHRAIQRVYNDYTSLNSRESNRLSAQEQKIDTLTGRYRVCHEDLRSLNNQIDSIINTAAALRARIEQVEKLGSIHRAQTPPTKLALDGTSEGEPRLSLNATADTKSRNPFWTAQIIFVLNAARPNIFEVSGIAYLKVQSRSSRQKVHFSSSSSLSFVLGVEGSFPNVLQNRTWMPLASHRLSDTSGNARITLDRLPPRQRESDVWDREFLEKHCITYDATEKAHIYIALQQGELTLDDLNGTTPRKTETNIANTTSTKQSTSNNPTSAIMPPARAAPSSSAQNGHSPEPNTRPYLRPQHSAQTTRDFFNTKRALSGSLPATRPTYESTHSSGANTTLEVVPPMRHGSKREKWDWDWSEWKRGRLFRRNTGEKLFNGSKIG